jgi:pyruvate carboxylase
MILKIFSIIINMFIDNIDNDDTSNRYQNLVPSVGSSSPALPFDIKMYPFVSGLFVIYGESSGWQRDLLTREILKTAGLKEKTDYMINKEHIYFTTIENKKIYDKVGQEIYACALAAANFNDLQKNTMGHISFVDENKFYIIVRPKEKMEKELLSMVTLFFKSHGYSVDQEYFQDNFYSYENFSLKFYVKDEAMAAELSLYIESKNLGVIL